MKQHIKQICKQIHMDKELDRNIPIFMNHLVSSYYAFSQLQLGFNLEIILEETKSEELHNFTELIIEILKQNVLEVGQRDLLKAIETLAELRRTMEKQMEVVEHYTELASIYEYIFNRLEYRFKEPDFELMADEDFVRKILNYIFEDEDNVIINEKIKEVIEQLPIRLTKSKFLDLLSNSLDLYKNAEEQSFETYLYLIRSVATLSKPKGLKELYPEFAKEARWLKKLDFNAITKDNFLKAQKRLCKFLNSINQKSYWIYQFQTIVNELYAVLACMQYQGVCDDYDEVNENTRIIISKIVTLYEQGCNAYDDDLSILFEQQEGIQEELIDEISYYDSVLEKLNMNDEKLVEDLMLKPILNSVNTASKLLSSSLFVNIEEKVNDRLMSEESFKKKKDLLLKEFLVLFEQNELKFNRAIMAGVLGCMPVFLSTHKEVMDYIMNAVFGCTDFAEKLAMEEIINFDIID